MSRRFSTLAILALLAPTAAAWGQRERAKEQQTVACTPIDLAMSTLTGSAGQSSGQGYYVEATDWIYFNCSTGNQAWCYICATMTLSGGGVKEELYANSAPSDPCGSTGNAYKVDLTGSHLKSNTSYTLTVEVQTPAVPDGPPPCSSLAPAPSESKSITIKTPY